MLKLLSLIRNGSEIQCSKINGNRKRDDSITSSLSGVAKIELT